MRYPDVFIRVLNQNDERNDGEYTFWVPIYEGSRDYMPEKFREAVALLDAADEGEVQGVGQRCGAYYYLRAFRED